MLVFLSWVIGTHVNPDLLEVAAWNRTLGRSLKLSGSVGEGFCDRLEMSALGTARVGRSSVFSILWETVCGGGREWFCIISSGGACHTVLETRKVGAET